MENTRSTVCFVANFYKTYLFHEIAQKLIKNGVSICWIVTKEDQYTFLKQHYATEQVLYISRLDVNKPNPIVDEFKLNELIYGDRVWKHEVGNGLKFLTNIQEPLYEFLRTNRVRFVIGEITWAHELLIQRIVKKRKELNCLYLDCSLVRIPNNRIAFFTDESQGEMLEFDGKDTATEVIKLEKPSYLKLNDKIVNKSKSLAGRLGRVKRFISGENIGLNDPNVIINKAIRFRVNSKEEYNKNTYNKVERVDFENVENDPYVFIGFHKQPESSIDVSGRYYEDQHVNIINLWRMLPSGWKILVKEHTNAIGDRSYSFYKKLLSYPGIVMVNEATDSKRIIEKSRLVATVTGTIAYEAALMKVPAITFAKTYFNRINYCRQVTIPDLLKYNSLADLCDELRNQEDNRLEFSQYLMKNTFDGYISDYVTDATVMDDANIEKLAGVFMKLIERYQATG
jgi:hypothetical protein